MPVDADSRSHPVRVAALIRERTLVLTGPEHAHLSDAELIEVAMQVARAAGLTVERTDLQVMVIDGPASRP